MRRHLPTLAHAFRFYGAWVASVTAVVALAMFVLVAALESVALAGLLCLPVLAVGAVIGSAYVGVARGLDQRRPWARWAGLALSVLVLGDLPVGTALGLLGVGVLTDDDVATAFAAPPPRPLLS